MGECSRGPSQQDLKPELQLIASIKGAIWNLFPWLILGCMLKKQGGERSKDAGHMGRPVLVWPDQRSPTCPLPSPGAQPASLAHREMIGSGGTMLLVVGAGTQYGCTDPQIMHMLLHCNNIEE